MRENRDEVFRGFEEPRSISSLQCEAHATAKSHGFWDKDKNAGECIALMHSELSEALEGIRKNNWENVAEELADAVIRIMDFCEAHKICLQGAIEKKMFFNLTRQHKHGKKF